MRGHLNAAEHAHEVARVRKLLNDSSAAHLKEFAAAWPDDLLVGRRIQEADIVDLAHDGRGVARVDGKAVFIDGALPGERVRLRVSQAAPSHWTKRGWSRF